MGPLDTIPHIPSFDSWQGLDTTRPYRQAGQQSIYACTRQAKRSSLIPMSNWQIDKKNEVRNGGRKATAWSSKRLAVTWGKYFKASYEGAAKTEEPSNDLCRRNYNFQSCVVITKYTHTKRKYGNIVYSIYLLLPEKDRAEMCLKRGF